MEQKHSAPKRSSTRHSLQVLLRAGFSLLSGLEKKFTTFKSLNKLYSPDCSENPLAFAKRQRLKRKAGRMYVSETNVFAPNQFHSDYFGEGTYQAVQRLKIN